MHFVHFARNIHNNANMAKSQMFNTLSLSRIIIIEMKLKKKLLSFGRVFYRRLFIVLLAFYVAFHFNALRNFIVSD